MSTSVIAAAPTRPRTQAQHERASRETLRLHPDYSILQSILDLSTLARCFVALASAGGPGEGQGSKLFPSQMQIEPNPGLIQQSPAKLNQRKSLDFLRRNRALSRRCADPQGLFFFAPLPASKEATGQRRRCPFARVCRFLCLHFGFLLAFSSEVKGWRRFYDRGRMGVLSPDLAAAEPMSAKKGTPPSTDPRVMSPGTATSRKKTGRSIRCPARIRPPKEPEPVSSPMDKRTGASPSCPEYLTTPAF